MPLIREKMDRHSHALLLYLNIVQEGNSLTLCAIRESSRKRSQGRISIKWCLGFIISMKKAMLIVTSNQKIFCSARISNSNSLISDLPFFGKAGMGREFCIPNWVLKDIWPLKFMAKTMRESKQMFLPLVSYCSLCTLDVHHSKEPMIQILTSSF